MTDDPRQFSLFPERTRLDRAAAKFHAKHPEFMRFIIRESRSIHRRGHQRWSINAAFEVARYEFQLSKQVGDAEDYKLNNNHRAWYARQVMALCPELPEKFFQTRARRGL